MSHSAHQAWRAAPCNWTPRGKLAARYFHFCLLQYIPQAHQATDCQTLPDRSTSMNQLLMKILTTAAIAAISTLIKEVTRR